MIGKTRVDTWQKSPSKQPRRQSFSPVRILPCLFRFYHDCHNYQVDKPVHIHGRSRLDTWNSSQIMAVTRQQVSHQPVHILARSKLNTWQSKTTDAPRRTKSVPVFTPLSLDVQPKARVDTWLRHRARSISTVRVVDKPVRVNGRSKIDSWSQIPIERNRKSLSNPTFNPKIEAKSRIDTWSGMDYQPRRSTIAVRKLFLSCLSHNCDWLDSGQAFDHQQSISNRILAKNHEADW